MARLPYLKLRGGVWVTWIKSTTTGAYCKRSTGIRADDLTKAAEFSAAIVKFRKEFKEDLSKFGIARQIHDAAARCYFEPLLPKDNSKILAFGTVIDWPSDVEGVIVNEVILDDEALRRTRLIEGTNVKLSQRNSELEAMVEILQQKLGVTSRSTAPFAETRDEYVAWGTTQGGRGGRPWSHHHARKRKAQLLEWERWLSLKTLGEIDLARAEAKLRKFEGSGKTKHSYLESLSAFCAWAVDRKYLQANPLENAGEIDTTPEESRRALTPDEIKALLGKCKPERRTLYMLAICSGLRKNELMSLTVADLDAKNSCLRLRPEWTKNRKGGWQPLPAALSATLAADAEGHLGSAPLLHVPSDASARFETDRKRADLKKETEDGVCNFACLRQTYITLCNDTGATVKATQTLARHSTPTLTFKTYARARSAELVGVVERLGALVGA